MKKSLFEENYRRKIQNQIFNLARIVGLSRHFESNSSEKEVVHISKIPGIYLKCHLSNHVAISLFIVSKFSFLEERWNENWPPFKKIAASDEIFHDSLRNSGYVRRAELFWYLLINSIKYPIAEKIVNLSDIHGLGTLYSSK